jgi:hypothetical protein
MPCIFNLDEPLLEQQSVREMCEGTAESSHLKLSQDNLLTIAQALIVSELSDSNEDECELTNVELFFEAPRVVSELLETSRSSEESDTSVTEKVEDVEFPPLPVTKKFLNRLINRLDEAAASSSLASSQETRLLVNFASRSVELGHRYCCGGLYAWNKDNTCNKKVGCIPDDGQRPIMF